MKALRLRGDVFVELQGESELRSAHAAHEFVWVLLGDKSAESEALLVDLFGDRKSTRLNSSHVD